MNKISVKPDSQLSDEAKNFELISQEKQEIKTKYEEEVKRNIFLAVNTTRDKDLLEGFMHQTIQYASIAKAKLQNILQFPNHVENLSVAELMDIFASLLEINEKIISTSRFASTANFRLESSMITEDFNGFIVEYIDKIASAYNNRIIITHRIDSKRFELKFNPIEIGMVLENLICNAKKAKSSSIIFSSKVKSNGLDIVIEDNGNGLPKEIGEKNRIFEKGFSRTNGSGLGLYLCKQMIENLGGKIFVAKKQPDHGTRFKIQVN